MPPRRTLLIVAVPVLVLASCSNQEGPINRAPQSGSATASDVAGVQQITLEAGDTYRFTPSTFTVHPGMVRVVLKNVGRGAPHDWSVPQFPAEFVPLAGAGETKQATFTAPAVGRYEFVCTIHVRQGQRGTMIVAP